MNAYNKLVTEKKSNDYRSPPAIGCDDEKELTLQSAAQHFSQRAPLVRENDLEHFQS